MSVLVYTYYILYTSLYNTYTFFLVVHFVYAYAAYWPGVARPLGEALSIASSPWFGSHDDCKPKQIAKGCWDYICNIWVFPKIVGTPKSSIKK